MIMADMPQRYPAGASFTASTIAGGGAKATYFDWIPEPVLAIKTDAGFIIK